MFIRSVIIFLFLSSISLLNNSYIYAGSLSEEAAAYREKGFEAQENSDIDAAISWYQKSVALDMDYAVPHNDLGILYEAKGLIDRAETEYKKALEIDRNYAKAHTNLALLYERKGELEKAAFHWMKRYRLGKPGEIWREEARQRLEKLGLIGVGGKGAMIQPAEEREREYSGTERQAKKNIEEKKKSTIKKPEPGGWTRLGSKAREKTTIETKTKQVEEARKSALQEEIQESLRLAEERLREERMQQKTGEENLESVKKNVSRKVAEIKTSRSKKESLTSKPNSKTKASYSKARSYYRKGEYSRALDTIRIAKMEYPDDTALLELEQIVKDKMKEERIEDHYNEGILLYHQNDYAGAREQFETILDMLPE